MYVGAAAALDADPYWVSVVILNLVIDVCTAVDDRSLVCMVQNAVRDRLLNNNDCLSDPY
jgi:hypothetical protein